MIIYGFLNRQWHHFEECKEGKEKVAKKGRKLNYIYSS